GAAEDVVEDTPATSILAYVTACVIVATLPALAPEPGLDPLPLAPPGDPLDEELMDEIEGEDAGEEPEEEDADEEAEDEVADEACAEPVEDEGLDEEVEGIELGVEGDVDETVGLGGADDGDAKGLEEAGGVGKAVSALGDVPAAPDTPLPPVIVIKTSIPGAPSVPTEVAQVEYPQPISLYPIGYVLM
ncbi:MAG: hypothetical protein M1830_009641, partial [Pleopsidium flavum]